MTNSIVTNVRDITKLITDHRDDLAEAREAIDTEFKMMHNTEMERSAEMQASLKSKREIMNALVDRHLLAIEAVAEVVGAPASEVVEDVED